MSWIRPLPAQSPENEPFFAGLRARKFLVPRCTACGNFNWTPYPACRTCLSVSQEWTEIPAAGELYTFSVIHVGPKAFTQDGPYAWGFVKLHDGPRPVIVMGNIRGCPLDTIRIGMRLKVAYEDVPDRELTMYHFEPA